MYYVYAYLRSKDSETACAGTPYYIGKGKRNRRFGKHRKSIPIPEDDEHNVLVLQGVTEEEAHFEEMYLIHVYGRADNGTGILRNLTDGGEGCSGCIPGQETRRKMREFAIGRTQSPASRAKMSKAKKGKQPSQAAIEAARLVTKGVPMSEENKEKRRHPKKPKSPDTPKKILTEEWRSNIANALRGVPHTEERKANIKEAQRKRRERERLEKEKENS